MLNGTAICHFLAIWLFFFNTNFNNIFSQKKNELKILLVLKISLQKKFNLILKR